MHILLYFKNVVTYKLYFSTDILVDIVEKCCRLNLEVFAQKDYYKKAITNKC